MKEWQFTVSVQIEDGTNVEINGLLTPKVYADSFGEAINTPEITQFCTDHKCTIYKILGR